MRSISEISAGDIIRRDYKAINYNENLSKVKSRMESFNFTNMPVLHNDAFKGMISYRELVKEARVNPESTKLKKVIHQPPEISGDEDLPSLASKRINSGRKKFAVLDGKKLEGMIGEEEMVFSLKNGIRELKGLKLSDLSQKDVIKIYDDDRLDKAREVMIENDISRLPVVDKEKELVGMLREFDVLREMIPREKMSKGDFKGEKESLSDVPVSEVMTRTPLFSEEDISISEAIDQMEAQEASEIILCGNGKPKEILTFKDVLKYLARFSVKDYMRVNLTGVDTESEKVEIHNKIEKAFQGPVGRVLREPEELQVRYKKSEKEGKRHRYELAFKLFSELGTTEVKEEGWDLLNVVDSALDQLEKIVKKEKDKQKEKR